MKHALLLVLAACATTRGAEDEDERRLANTADRNRGEDPGLPAREEPPPTAPPARQAPPPAAADLAGAMNKLRAAVDRANAECKELEGLPVSYQEERMIGGRVALAYAKSGQGLLLDTSAAITADVAKSGLPRGAKNDLTAYVQVVGAWVARGSSRPGIAWSFGVIESEDVASYSAMGGWVLVTTGMLRLMDNEAMLAGALAREISLISSRGPVKSYARAKSAACRTALSGYYLVEAGSSGMPGGEEFVRNAKFGRTMKKMSGPSWFDKDPDVDADFILWFANRIVDLESLVGLPREDQDAADRGAVELMAAAGYDAAQYGLLLAKLPSATAMSLHHAPPADRAELVRKTLAEGTFGAGSGKAPRFPAGVTWPPKPAN